MYNVRCENQPSWTKLKSVLQRTCLHSLYKFIGQVQTRKHASLESKLWSTCLY